MSSPDHPRCVVLLQPVGKKNLFTTLSVADGLKKFRV